VQTAPGNPANAGTAPPQRPVPSILRRVWTLAEEAPPSRPVAWDPAAFFSLFCASRRGRRQASQVARRWPSSTLPGSLKVSQLPGCTMLRNRLHRRRSRFSLRLSLRPWLEESRPPETNGTPKPYCHHPLNIP
jgi:hypothetical protein